MSTMHNIRFWNDQRYVYAWLDGEQVYLCAMPTEEAAAAKVQELRRAMENGSQSEQPEYRRIFAS